MSSQDVSFFRTPPPMDSSGQPLVTSASGVSSHPYQDVPATHPIPEASDPLIALSAVWSVASKVTIPAVSALLIGVLTEQFTKPSRQTQQAEFQNRRVGEQEKFQALIDVHEGIKNFYVRTPDGVYLYVRSNKGSEVRFTPLDNETQFATADAAMHHIDDLPKMMQILTNAQYRPQITSEVSRSVKQINRKTASRAGLFGAVSRRLKREPSSTAQTMSDTIFGSAELVASSASKAGDLSAGAVYVSWSDMNMLVACDGESLYVIPYTPEEAKIAQKLYECDANGDNHGRPHTNCGEFPANILKALSEHYARKWHHHMQVVEPSSS